MAGKKRSEIEPMVGEKVIGSQVEPLPCVLTPGEKAIKAQELGALLGDLQAHDESAKEMRAKLKADRESIDVRIRSLGRTLRHGTEQRPVTIQEEANYSRNLVFVVRTDTGEVVRERPLQPYERQHVLGIATPDSDEKN